jgi:exopolysaccharide production protein ExoZ
LGAFTVPGPSPISHRNGAKMRSIEAARGLAALSVVLMHSANFMRVENLSGHVGLGGIFDFGYVGVDFFFVLSGFIITYVHFADIGRIERIPSYLWRRFSRIYPIYWAILLLVIGITTFARFASGSGAGWEIGVSDVAGTVLLVMGEGEPKYVGVAWSLQYELVFYLAFALLLVSARIGAGVFVAWGLFVLARALGLAQIDLPLHLGNAHCLEFLFGVAVGASARRYVLRASPTLLIAVLVALVAAVVFEVYGPFGRHAAAGRLALGLASAGVLAGLVALEDSGALRPPAWLASMGSASYSIYLGHSLFINTTYVVLLKLGLYHALPEGLVFIVAVCAALSATYLIGIYVELPLVRALKDRFPARRVLQA